MQSQAMQVLTSKNTVSWYTPPQYIALARTVMDDIDLDPATAEIPQSWIKAKMSHGIERDGLKYAWLGRLWLNPPFDNTSLWLQKTYAEIDKGNIDQAILLVNSNHGYKWYEELWRKFPVCCVRERIEFITDYDPQEIMYGTANPYYINGYTLMTKGQAKRGQTFAYYGANVELFYETFKHIGRVIIPPKKG